MSQISRLRSRYLHYVGQMTDELSGGSNYKRKQYILRKFTNTKIHPLDFRRLTPMSKYEIKKNTLLLVNESSKLKLKPNEEKYIVNKILNSINISRYEIINLYNYFWGRYYRNRKNIRIELISKKIINHIFSLIDDCTKLNIKKYYIWIDLFVYDFDSNPKYSPKLFLGRDEYLLNLINCVDKIPSIYILSPDSGEDLYYKRIIIDMTPTIINKTRLYLTTFEKTNSNYVMKYLKKKIKKTNISSSKPNENLIKIDYIRCVCGIYLNKHMYFKFLNFAKKYINEIEKSDVYIDIKYKSIYECFKKMGICNQYHSLAHLHLRLRKKYPKLYDRNLNLIIGEYLILY